MPASARPDTQALPKILLRLVLICVGALGMTLASSCGTVSYLWQAGKGQLAMANHARPIEEAIRDETTPPRTRELLAEIPQIKAYGEKQGLKPTPNYREYVKLDRPAASWVVSACEPLRFEPKEWSFPIVGSFPYLGWFDLQDAKEYAAELKREGWDVDVRGARAYSTLGWFRDPVLSSMIPKGVEAEGDLVNVILHESVHATLYIKGQSSFNETLASFVADEMTPRYLASARGKGSPELKAYLASEREDEEARLALHQAYGKLEKLYASSATDEEKLRRKAGILGALKKNLGFQRDINNATLIQYRTYETGTPLFEKLYKTCGEDWKKFLGALRGLKPETFPEPQAEKLEPVLSPLIENGCPQSGD